MGWSITVLENTVKISKKLAKELFAAQEYEEEIWYDIDDVMYDGLLSFNSDHSEHMDYLSTNDKIVKILKKAKVKGKICFADVEGDSSPSFWGYSFDGNGGMVKLVGEVTWHEDNATSE